MHGKYAFVRIETVTERRRLRRLFLRFSFADCMHLAGGCRNEVEITAKTRWLCPFANCTKKQLFRRGYASIFLLLSGSLFCTVFFCVFSFADCRHIASGCRNEVEITAKLAGCALCKLYEKTTFSAWLCKHFPAFGMLFVLHRLFCIGRVFSVCRKRAQTPAQSTKEYLFFLFSAKAVLLAFLYFCFGQIFTSLHLFLAVKIIKCK